jgi:serine/threonine-protein kinase RsbW
MFIEEVTVHTFTQQFCHRLGFADCAYLLAYSPATMAFTGIAEETSARRSVIVGFKYLKTPLPSLVHVPARHRDMIARIYESLGAPATIANEGEPLRTRGVPDASVVHVSVNTSRSVATIRIPVYGLDLERRVHHEMHRLRREEVKVMNVSLNLGAPGTGVVAAALEKAGFVFTGLIPGGPSGDWLVLQYFNGVLVDYDAVQVEAPFSRELLAYIRAHDPHAG